MSTTITHQQIADRVVAIDAEQRTAERAAAAIAAKPYERERASLQELCGGIGHVFVHPQFALLGSGRRCAACELAEPGADAGAVYVKP